jgi:very-short-patch-repair endonuclease
VEQAAHDARRTAYLGAQGVRVIRLWAAEVMAEELDGALAGVAEAAAERIGDKQGASR